MQATGSVRAGYARSNPKPGTLGDIDQYFFSLGLAEGFELGGRIVEGNKPGGDIRDLSLTAKYQVPLAYGATLALGASDFGGKVQVLRSRYLVATAPWRSTSFTVGYGAGPELLKGPFGGFEWRPAPFVSFNLEGDRESTDAGTRLVTGELLGRLRLGVSAAWRSQTHDVDYGADIEVALDRQSDLPELAPISRSEAQGSTLIETLRNLGFESIRTATRGMVQVVALENRTYNHSSADGLAVALSAIASQMAPGTQTIELTLYAYGMPQVTVITDRALTHFHVRNSAGYVNEPDWDPGSVDGLSSTELVIEPLLRTFVATESGVLDYGFAVRPRLVVPLGSGVIFGLGVQVPVANSDDFRKGQNFGALAPSFGIDPMLLQYAHKFTPGWSSLWSAGRTRIYQLTLNTLATEHFWLSADGTHQLRAKVMRLSATGTHDVAIAGYTYFDPAHSYSASLSGGRYFAGDTGLRADLSRYFGDVVCTIFVKGTGAHDAVAGFMMSLPLTPRRDAMPTGLQVKGPRRWGHGLSTTVNSEDGTNILRPLLVYEPSLDLDLRRDFADSSRLGEAYLQQEIPRRLAQ